MDKNTLVPLLPEFISWARLEKDSELETARKQVYIFGLFFRHFPSFNLENCRSFILLSKDLGKKASTIEKYVHAFSVFCDFLIYRGIINSNWARTIPIPKREKLVPTILSVSEIEAILNCSLTRTYGHSPNPRLSELTFNTILALLAKTGSRLGEVLGAKIQDFNLLEGVWTLNYTKTMRGRLVPIPPDLIPDIRLIIGNRSPEEYIFLNPINNLPVRHHQLENNFRLRLKKCGINKLAVVHTLRHSFITELLRQDVSVLKIANVVGHENIKTTQEYAKLLYEDLRDAILRHPLTAKNRNPYDIVNQVKETIEKFHLKEDSRFMYSLDDSNQGLRITIFVR